LPEPAGTWASSTASRASIGLRPTARPSASSRRRCANGPTAFLPSLLGVSSHARALDPSLQLASLVIHIRAERDLRLGQNEAAHTRPDLASRREACDRELDGVLRKIRVASLGAPVPLRAVRPPKRTPRPSGPTALRRKARRVALLSARHHGAPAARARGGEIPDPSIRRQRYEHRRAMTVCLMIQTCTPPSPNGVFCTRRGVAPCRMNLSESQRGLVPRGPVMQVVFCRSRHVSKRSVP
jgi:hypothetical protein